MVYPSYTGASNLGTMLYTGAMLVNQYMPLSSIAACIFRTLSCVSHGLAVRTIDTSYFRATVLSSDVIVIVTCVLPTTRPLMLRFISPDGELELWNVRCRRRAGACVVVADASGTVVAVAVVVVVTDCTVAFPSSPAGGAATTSVVAFVPFDTGDGGGGRGGGDAAWTISGIGGGLGGNGGGKGGGGGDGGGGGGGDGRGEGGR